MLSNAAWYSKANSKMIEEQENTMRRNIIFKVNSGEKTSHVLLTEILLSHGLKTDSETIDISRITYKNIHH